jgi:hypothetical protein
MSPGCRTGTFKGELCSTDATLEEGGILLEFSDESDEEEGVGEVGGECSSWPKVCPQGWSMAMTHVQTVGDGFFADPS